MNILLRSLLKTIALLAAAVAVMAACTGGSATIAEPVAVASSAVADPAEPPPAPAATATATRVPSTPAPTATVAPTEPAQEDVSIIVDATTPLDLNPDAGYGYFAARNAWLDPVECDSAPNNVLVGVDVQASTTEDIVLFDAGFSTAGNVQQMTFSPHGRAAALISCGESTATPWLQIVDFDDAGQVTAVGPVLTLPHPASASGPYLGEWIDAESVLIYMYPDGGLQEVIVGADTGETVLVVEPTPAEEDLRRAEKWTYTPDRGLRYRVADDPQGRNGCEGNGVAVTLEVDDGSGPKPALPHPDQVYPAASKLQFGPSGLITWNVWCEGFATPFVGQIQADGTITDAHYIDISAVENLDGASTEYLGFGLNTDGYLISIGTKYAQDVEPQVSVFRYDAAGDLNSMS